MTDSHIDNWVADNMRLCALPPPVAIHVAAIVLGILATSGQLFPYTARGTLYNGSRSLSSSAVVKYTMTTTTSCVTSTTGFERLGLVGPTDCFDNTTPRRLVLAGDPASTTSAFRVATLPVVAPLAPPAPRHGPPRTLADACALSLLVAGVCPNTRPAGAAHATQLRGRGAPPAPHA